MTPKKCFLKVGIAWFRQQNPNVVMYDDLYTLHWIKVLILSHLLKPLQHMWHTFAIFSDIQLFTWLCQRNTLCSGYPKFLYFFGKSLIQNGGSPLYHLEVNYSFFQLSQCRDDS
jgi:hypothetical protein